MTALIGAVFLASLLGSAHCAAMCGGFACLASSGQAGTAASWRATGAASAAYHAGRLTAYLSLGVVAGLLGGLVEDAGRFAGLQRAAAIGSSVLIIAWGLALLAEQRGMRLPLPAPLEPAQRWLGARLAALRDRPPVVRGAALGLLTTLLPCGWLYAYVVVAAGTGAVAPAVLVMAVFWTGTVPALLVVGAGMRTLAGPLRARLPQMTAVALVAIGLVSLARRTTPHVHAGATPPAAAAAAAAGAATPMNASPQSHEHHH
ncbi:MAG: sulfite exporter TauE/SafE family protein [Gemmatimonadaceae bacterium]|nr:sulfite exporter TauE/SafE family protein [Gemmatimonadaceae bacterium]